MDELQQALQLVGLVFFEAILGGFALYLMVRALVRWIDSTSPLNRSDRRQLRTVSRGKRAMARDR